MNVDFGLLNQQNFGQQLRQGQQSAIDLQNRKQQGELLNLEIQKTISEKEATEFNKLSNGRKQRYIDSMSTTAALINANDIAGARNVILKQIEDVKKDGGDPTSSIRALAIFDADPQMFAAGVEPMVANRGGSINQNKRKFKDDVSTPRTDPNTGQQYVIVSPANGGAPYRQDVDGAVGDSNQQLMDNETRLVGLKAAIDRGNEAFDKIGGITTNINNMERAIELIDDNARYGQIENLLPAFDRSTIELRNIANQLGLDVVAGTTFGALSEGELRLAMETAVPRLDEKDLRGWFKSRVDAKSKLRKELIKMSRVLGGGKTTIPEYLDANQKPDKDEFDGFSILN